MGNVVTPDHKYWRAVCIRLSDQLNIHGCQRDLRNTEKILKSLPDVEVEDTLELYRRLGGFYDYEVLANVVPSWIRENEDKKWKYE